MRSKFDTQLMLLNEKLILMGARCEKAIASAVKALLTGDIALAADTIATDQEVDEMEKEIENLCLNLLLLQQPVAKDLRLVSAALKMITDMERIGDQAADIAEIVTYSNLSEYAGKTEIGDMARAAIGMVSNSIDSFVKRDLELAKEVIDSDDVVDSLFLNLRAGIIKLLADESADGEKALDIFMIAKYLERIGDHATNIAEWVEFSITGVRRKD